MGFKRLCSASLALLVVGGVIGTPLGFIYRLIQSRDKTLDGRRLRVNLGIVTVSAFQRVAVITDQFCEGASGGACNSLPRLDDGIGLGLASGGGLVSGDTHGVLLCGGDFNNFIVVSIFTVVNSRNQ